MKKIPVFMIFMLFLGFCSVSYAHPPSDIKITFDTSTKMLKAAIIHNTSNPQKHYINKVDIGLNGQEIIEHKISREDNNNSQTVEYLIPDTKETDVISVEGYCSISGKLKKEIIVKSE